MLKSHDLPCATDQMFIPCIAFSQYCFSKDLCGMKGKGVKQKYGMKLQWLVNNAKLHASRPAGVSIFQKHLDPGC